ncbi:hypothetical protein [Scytonema sp. PCC 10023]
MAKTEEDWHGEEEKITVKRYQAGDFVVVSKFRVDQYQ